MDKLNYECLEHIFCSTNCGPKEWLVLSKVCKFWREVVSKFWQQINRIEIIQNNFDSEQPYLSSENVIVIMRRAGQYVTEINITARKINNIRLGKFSYNLSGLDMDACLNSFESQCANRILKTTFYAENQVCRSIMRSNPDLKNITLVIDKNLYTWNFEENVMEELELICHSNCKVPFNEVSFDL